MNGQSRVIAGFTTSSSPAESATHLPLDDSALGVHKTTKSTPHRLVSFPSSGRQADEGYAWEAFYPKGSINPGNKNAPAGGFGFYLNGGDAFVNALKETVGKGDTVDIVMGYDIFFERDWEWAKGGKLSGMCTFIFSSVSAEPLSLSLQHSGQCHIAPPHLILTSKMLLILFIVC